MQQAGPITNTNSNTFIFAVGAFFTGTTTETSGYGSLFESGSGTVNTADGNGASGDLGPDVGGAPLASYTDLLTITGTGPVSIQFSETFAGSTSTTGEASASVSDELLIDGPSFDQDDILNISGTATNVLTFNPGDQVQIFGELRAQASSGFDALAAQIATETFGYQASDSLDVDVLTPGGGYISASGTLYPTGVSSSPEPGSLLLLGGALVGLAGFLRMRRAHSK